MFIRRVNPNRVHLATDLVYNPDGSSQVRISLRLPENNLTLQMSIAAEYILKQSKLHMSADSNLVFKSVLETTVMPGFTVQLSAEEQHFKEIYKFGVGIMMG